VNKNSIEGAQQDSLQLIKYGEGTCRSFIDCTPEDNASSRWQRSAVHTA